MRLLSLALVTILVGCTSGSDAVDSKVPEETDRDGDGYTFAEGDCDDDDHTINPDAEEEWYNGVDEDCDGNDDDQDADNYGTGDGDCDDEDADINPAANEVCDGVDNNCGGGTDEDLLVTVYPDEDNDGFGDEDIEVEACADDLPNGYTEEGGDCDDTDRAINPDEDDGCDGLDNNCDGDIDENAPAALYADTDGDGFGDPAVSVGGCDTTAGYVEDNTDCNDADATTYPGATELCDSIDNDCDGEVDGESAGTNWYTDADADGYGDPATAVVACEAPEGTIAMGDDCDDTNVGVNPGAAESCDTLDNNCDGSVDEGVILTFYSDADGDGYGDSTLTTDACEAPEGYAALADDCDDTNALVSPGTPELCDDTLDNDCDGLVDGDDEVITSMWYADADSDSFGDAAVMTESCSQPTGYVLDATDCNDTDGTIYPGNSEVCDGVDNDCDSLVDNEAVDASTWYTDADTDGYGDPASAELTCTPAADAISTGDDCDDTDPAVNPAGSETCNGLDDNCDGETDEAGASGEVVWYLDSDLDTFGDPDTTVDACDPPEGYTGNAEDCDDSNAAVYADAPELCDSVDNDCDGTIDDDPVDPLTSWYDGDADGYGVDGSEVTGCDVPAGYVTVGGDCDDDNAALSPGIGETDDGVDENCDGLIDEEFVNFGDLVITEIYRQPRFGGISTDDDGQWFEVYNTSARDVNMSGWTIARSGLISEVNDVDLFQVDPEAPVIVASGSYAVFCHINDFEGSAAAYPLACDYYWGNEAEANNAVGTTWNNTFHLQRDEDSLTLYLGSMETGMVVDDLYWFFDSTNGEWPRDARFSMTLDPAMIDPDLNDDLASWCSISGAVNDTAWAWYDNAGTDDDEHGTPGATNYDCP